MFVNTSKRHMPCRPCPARLSKDPCSHGQRTPDRMPALAQGPKPCKVWILPSGAYVFLDLHHIMQDANAHRGIGPLLTMP